MTSKWSTVSFFGLGTLLAAGMAAAGCSVSTGGIDDVGGTGTEIPDSSTGTDSSTVACAANTKQTAIFTEACQAELNAQCCTQLANFFGATPTDPSKPSDGNALIACIDRCNYKADGTTACTTDADCTTENSACLLESDNTMKCHDYETDYELYRTCKETDCEQALTQPDIIAAEGALDSCINADATAKLECGSLVRSE